MPEIRHAALDHRIAEEGVNDEVIAIYGDWLLEGGHRTSEAWMDTAARGAVIDPFSTDHFDLPELTWHRGLIVRVGLGQWFNSDRPDDPDADTILQRLLAHPSAFVVQQIRREVGAPGTTLLTGLRAAPPTVGRVEIADPAVFEDPEEKTVALSSLRMPHLHDLRLRVSRVVDVPDLSALRRLEVFMDDPQPLAKIALPQLRALYLWADSTHRDARFLLQQAPQLEVVGLYGGAWDALDDLPESVHTVIVGAGPQPDWTTLEALIPATVRRIVVQTLREPLPEPHGRLSASADPDLPLPPRLP